MAKIKLVNGKEFTLSSGTTLLDAASSAGIVFPYSCRTGRCSTCKARVRRGHTSPLNHEMGISSAEIAAGWILTCVRTAETDVELDIDDLGGVQFPPPKTIPCRIVALEKLTSDVLRVKLRPPPTAAFSFIPGQYIDVIGFNGTRRSYSLANANFIDRLLELHVRSVDGGSMSSYWFNQAKVNDLLRINGPLGTFFLREFSKTDIFFLATGTGIAPIKAMLESLVEASEGRQPQSVTVLWGGRKPEDFYINMAAILGRHRYIPVLSRPHQGWVGERGHVQDILLSISPNFEKAAVYACGSDSMILSAKRVLSKAGLSLDRFYSDAFVASGNT